MKKIFGLFAMLFLLTGCDDGDITFKSFNFTNATAQACTNSGIIYKVQGSEALLLQLAPNTLINAENKNEVGDDIPRMITLGGSNTLVYRTYNGPVSSTSICSAVPPANPAVVEEYSAQAGGMLSIITKAVRNSQNVLTGYNHVITIINATFSREEESIIITDNVFGSFISPVTYRFSFKDEASTVSLQNCDGNLIPAGNAFIVNGDEALFFDIEPATYPTTDGGIAVVNFGIAGETQEIIFNEYSGTAVATLFCDAVPPITPVVTKQWEAIAGELRIQTSIVAGVREHIFFLDNVTFMNRAQNAEQFTISATGGYRVGKLTVAN
ncbi:hypothetical protein LRS05_16695 [Flavobacterium sp. J372]|uniref:hypothetical protein n=1 Tax=Flavobacterium sp. J372 TaxID=2898436 RepID=UPI0021516172|nr:hypothetical protein [Flavobacterium sp. J372]MCR5862633.1 hypothetical protein [Flavobacterium sp. J372]MCR5863635.1 hypothetical protein [Flavobacterium sp. J372]